MKLTNAQRHILQALVDGTSMRRRGRNPWGRTLNILRDAGLIGNDPRTGLYMITDEGRSRVSSK